MWRSCGKKNLSMTGNAGSGTNSLNKDLRAEIKGLLNSL
jgi:hypothetical protein